MHEAKIRYIFFTQVKQAKQQKKKLKKKNRDLVVKRKIMKNAATENGPHCPCDLHFLCSCFDDLFWGENK